MLGRDVLTARFVRVGSKDHLAEVHGDGHTALRRVSATGSGQYWIGRLPGGALSAVTAGRGSVVRVRASGAGMTDWTARCREVSDAVEQGHVVMTRLPVRKPGEAVAPLDRTSDSRAGDV